MPPAAVSGVTGNPENSVGQRHPVHYRAHAQRNRYARQPAHQRQHDGFQEELDQNPPRVSPLRPASPRFPAFAPPPETSMMFITPTPPRARVITATNVRNICIESIDRVHHAAPARRCPRSKAPPIPGMKPCRRPSTALTCRSAPSCSSGVTGVKTMLSMRPGPMKGLGSGKCLAMAV